MQQITGNVYAKTTFHGCNSGFIITGEGAVVIDTPMVPSEAKGWKQQIEKHAPIRYVIINEAHTDHYSGSCYLGGTLVGTEDSAKALSRAKVEDLVKELSWMAPGSPAPDEDFYFRRPDITINGEAKIYLGEHAFTILSVPGHTAKQL
ncbi:MAG: MBL fold metallo-hydrolase, partial [Deltaproteobacteria bacterium]|nr:MBL fold metallo-hydrolase [Deltaproteobacteria bacterium]